MDPNDLLREVLRYLKREDSSVPGIGAGRHTVKDETTGEEKEVIEGPEKRRFLIAEKVEKYLSNV
jgi:hypothetical protein